MATAATNGHPSTPPASDPAPPNTVPATAASAQAPAPATAEPDIPLTSLEDDGQSKRPRDARLIHLVLSSLGIHSYQERVPLQLLDFAYRYTSSVLSDSLRLSADGYAAQADRAGGGRARATAGDEGITITALRQAIASRQGYTFQGALPKEFMMERALEHNRVQLPKPERGYGVQLPPEKYCLTGVGWSLKDEWDSEEDETVVGDEQDAGDDGAAGDEAMGGLEGAQDEDEEGAGRVEDVFGEDGDGDTAMQD